MVGGQHTGAPLVEPRETGDFAPQGSARGVFAAYITASD